MDFSSDSFLSYRVRAIKKSAKVRNIDFNLDKNMLKTQLHLQDGRCALTGIKFWPKYNFSVDRIDSSKGYSMDNIQLVLLRINLAKHTMSNDKFIDMCNQVTEFSRTARLKVPAPTAEGTSPSTKSLASPFYLATTFRTNLRSITHGTKIN